MHEMVYEEMLCKFGLKKLTCLLSQQITGD